MSTICKLHPIIRRARRDRRDILRSLLRVVAFLRVQQPPPIERIALAMLTADHLHAITRNPWMRSSYKGKRFAALIKLLEATNEPNVAA